MVVYLLNHYNNYYNDLGAVIRESIIFSAYSTMAFCRGDSIYITIYIPGVYFSLGSTLTLNGIVSFCTASKLDIALSTTPTVYQEQWGIRFIVKQTGLGEITTCVFTSSFTITAS